MYFIHLYKYLQELNEHLHELTIEYETLKSRPPEVVTKTETKVVEKIPGDYENLKRTVSSLQTRCSEYESKCSSLESELHILHEEKETVKRHGKKHEEKTKFLQD